MFSKILFDNVRGPIFYVFWYGFLSLYFLEQELSDSILFIIIVFGFTAVFSFFKDDYYILDHHIEDGEIQINYNQNFSKILLSQKLNKQTLDSFSFQSKGFLGLFFLIVIKHKMDNGDLEKLTFKVADQDSLIELLYQLKNTIRQEEIGT